MRNDTVSEIMIVSPRSSVSGKEYFFKVCFSVSWGLGKLLDLYFSKKKKFTTLTVSNILHKNVEKSLLMPLKNTLRGTAEEMNCGVVTCQKHFRNRMYRTRQSHCIFPISVNASNPLKIFEGESFSIVPVPLYPIF